MYPCLAHACVMTRGVCRLSVRNARNPAEEGGTRSAMANRPVTGFLGIL